MTNLQKSKAVAAAAKAIGGLTCPLFVGDIDSVRTKADIIRLGLPMTIEAIDRALVSQQQILDVGQSFLNFLLAHPDEPGVAQHHFDHGTTEREVLDFIDPDSPEDGDVPDRHSMLRVIRVTGVLDMFGDEAHPPHVTRTEVYALLSRTQANIDGLFTARELLAPLMDDAPAAPVARCQPPAAKVSPTNKPIKLRRWEPEYIEITNRLRKKINEDTVLWLMESIRKIGLRSPPTIRIYVDDEGLQQAILVTGLHRVEACKRLGLKFIECEEFHGDEIEARKWEIAENLRRANLTVQEHAEHVAEWIRLTEEGQTVFSQVAKKTQGGRPEGGVNAAARELKIGKDEAYRAVRIAGIQPEAKAAAAAAKLNNNQSALMAIARAEPERQVQVVKEIVQRKAAAGAVTRKDRSLTTYETLTDSAEPPVNVTITRCDTPEPKPLNITITPETVEAPEPAPVDIAPPEASAPPVADAEDREFERLMAAWNTAGDEARRVFIERVGCVFLPDVLLCRAQILADTEGITREAYVVRSLDDAVTHAEAADANWMRRRRTTGI